MEKDNNEGKALMMVISAILLVVSVIAPAPPMMKVFSIVVAIAVLLFQLLAPKA